MGPPTRPRVLIADDYPAMVRAIARLLSVSCDVVGSVADGGDLVEAAVRLKPDVILLDLNMPQVNGLDACRQVKQVLPATKVIVLTAETDEVVVQRAMESGASAYVAKHALGDALLAAIERACDSGA